MPTPVRRPRLVVVSPFVDKRHGTERCVAEQIEHLAGVYEIHLYSSRVEDVDLTGITWHRVPAVGGPHLFAYSWWFCANRFQRWRDAKFRGIAPDVIYSPGVNCLDADVVSVHVLFSKVREQMARSLSAEGTIRAGSPAHANRPTAWPLDLHRRIYYRLIEFLEGKVYGREDIYLAAVSEKGAQDIRARFGEKKHLSVIYHGINSAKFNPQRRKELRPGARTELRLADDSFAVLFIGNDWRNRGLDCLLQAVAMMREHRVHVLVVGTDSIAAYQGIVEQHGLSGRVHFFPPRADVEFYYAAADAYAGPSLEDTFSLPPAEAMACGMPVITTRNSGVSEIIHHGKDGLVLENPTDAKTLSEWLARLASDAEWRSQMGLAAAKRAAQYTWDRNGALLQQMINSLLQIQTRARPNR
ncbi:MAG TPA: glycosyltransferase family 4 protein [Candidatus Acidoferrales bacterium]